MIVKWGRSSGEDVVVRGECSRWNCMYVEATRRLRWNFDNVKYNSILQKD